MQMKRPKKEGKEGKSKPFFFNDLNGIGASEMGSLSLSLSLPLASSKNC